MSQAGAITINISKIFSGLLFDIFYFPVWWYSSGAAQFARALWAFFLSRERKWALLIWIRNIFKPMYSQYDFWGIVISFFMRVFQIIFRSLILLFWLIILSALLLLWLGLPAFIGYNIYFQFK